MCGFGNDSSLWIIILLCLCGGNNSIGCGCNNGCGGNESSWIWILILLCGCGGFGNSGCGCGCGNTIGNCGTC